MKMFGRSGGYWLFWMSAIYLVAGFIQIYVYEFSPRLEYIQAVWVVSLSLPLWIKPMAQWLNIKTIWEQ
jgi:hypothetical protein